MMDYINDYKRNHWLRLAQFVFGALILSLSSYTLVSFTDWKQVRLTVATVCFLP